MQTLELILMGLAYTTLSIALFLSVLCYRKKIEQRETLWLIIALLLLIISLSLSPFLDSNSAENTSNIFTLLTMVLVAITTLLNVFTERAGEQIKKAKRPVMFAGGILFILTGLGGFLNFIPIMQPLIVSFLIAAVIGAMLVIRFTKPKKKYAHQERMERIFSLAFGLLIPVYLVFHFLFEEQYQSLQFGFIVPLVFILLGANKIYDDLYRLSLLTKNQLNANQPYLNHGLTERETEIAKLLVEGKTYREIAELLFISIPTVKTHASNIYKKCQVKTRHALVHLLNN